MWQGPVCHLLTQTWKFTTKMDHSAETDQRPCSEDFFFWGGGYQWDDWGRLSVRSAGGGSVPTGGTEAVPISRHVPPQLALASVWLHAASEPSASSGREPVSHGSSTVHPEWKRSHLAFQLHTLEFDLHPSWRPAICHIGCCHLLFLQVNHQIARSYWSASKADRACDTWLDLSGERGSANMGL